MEIIQIHCGVKYIDKGTAKSHGAKFNGKNWYFEFNLNEFLNDDTKHTRQFKPFRIDLINCDEFFKNAPIPIHKLQDLYFSKAKNRNRKFIEENTPIDMTEPNPIVLKRN